ncbi:MAG: RDD family protein [Terriglobia bacterium]
MGARSLIWMVLYFGFSVWWTNGRTLGNRLLRIRVVSLAHTKITLWQAVDPFTAKVLSPRPTASFIQVRLQLRRRLR